MIVQVDLEDHDVYYYMSQEQLKYIIKTFPKFEQYDALHEWLRNNLETHPITGSLDVDIEFGIPQFVDEEEWSDLMGTLQDVCDYY